MFRGRDDQIRSLVRANGMRSMQMDALEKVRLVNMDGSRIPATLKKPLRVAAGSDPWQRQL